MLTLKTKRLLHKNGNDSFGKIGKSSHVEPRFQGVLTLSWGEAEAALIGPHAAAPCCFHGASFAPYPGWPAPAGACVSCSWSPRCAQFLADVEPGLASWRGSGPGKCVRLPEGHRCVIQLCDYENVTSPIWATG